jgi:hypothetical protein
LFPHPIPLRFEVIRKPYGPDGTPGFTYDRTLKDSSQAPCSSPKPQETQIIESTAIEENSDGKIFEELVAKLCD